MCKKYLLLPLCYLFIFLLSSCQTATPQENTPLPSFAAEPSPTKTTILPSLTPPSSATPAPSPTQLPATATSAPTITQVDCLNQGGRVEIGHLSVDDSPTPLDYRIYLPPCYDEALEQSYPVLYLIHGQSVNDDQWDRLGVDEIMDKWVASGEISPFLIAMPRDTNWGTAEQDPFDEALLQGLIPYIDNHYRTIADRTHRAIGGLSRGAGWAANLGLQHPELFGSVGLHSLALFWSDVPYVKKWFDEIPAELMPRFYIDVGLNDRPEILESSRWFESLLDQRNIPHDWHLFAGYHEEGYWKLHLGQYLRWYAAGWSK